MFLVFLPGQMTITLVLKLPVNTVESYPNTRGEQGILIPVHFPTSFSPVSKSLPIVIGMGIIILIVRLNPILGIHYQRTDQFTDNVPCGGKRTAH